MLQPEGSIVETCHVVRDMDAAIAHWTGTLKAGPFFCGEMRLAEGHRNRGESAPLAIKVAFGFSGGLLIELVEPLEGDGSIFSEALAEHGPGFHHVMLRGGYDEGRARLSAQGFPVVLETVTPLGERCAVFDTRVADGGFVEVMDLQIAFEGMAQKMMAAHEGWDGSMPERPLAEMYAHTGGPA